MLRNMFAFGILLASAASAQVAADSVKFGPGPARLPKGSMTAVLGGNPEAGAYVVRLKVPPGWSIGAHHHKATEYSVGVSGEMRVGLGDKLDKDKTVPLGPGDFVEFPAGANHFAWSPKGAVVDIVTVGPSDSFYVDPADDPRRQ